MAVADYRRAQEQFTDVGLRLRDFRNDQGRGFQHDGRIVLGNACWLHVVHNWNAESRVNRFLASHGPGLEHLALETDNIEAAVAHLRERGVPFFEDTIFDANDGYEAFIYPDDAIGFTVELIKPHARSWGYPDDADAEPVTRLASVHAVVSDVDPAIRRFEMLFGLHAEGNAIRFGNGAALILEAGPASERGLNALCLDLGGRAVDTPPELGFTLLTGN